jgi:uncharacterized protein YbjT (DUF2867 family)
MPWSTGADVLAGVDVLVNTYWVRFSYKGAGHAPFSHGDAVENTKKLFAAARQSGVRRVVHTSITQPDAASELPYFRGKAELEEALQRSGLAHSILRPAILFGDSAGESILLNNMAWSLRHLPAVATFGMGKYRMQPIHVQDLPNLLWMRLRQKPRAGLSTPWGQRHTASGICGSCWPGPWEPGARCCRCLQSWATRPPECLAR